jgi:hypothetical protein
MFTIDAFRRAVWTYDFHAGKANKYDLTMTSSMSTGMFKHIIEFMLSRQKQIKVNIDYDNLDTFTFLDSQKKLAFKTLKLYMRTEVNKIFCEVREDGINPIDFEIKDLVFIKGKELKTWTIKVWIEGYYNLFKPIPKK